MGRSESQSATGNRHVMVVGMHRSGTSGMAHTLAELGLALPDPDDLVAPGPGNEQGHWESQILVDTDHELLRLLGGAWYAPPRAVLGWEQADGPIPEAFRSQATQLAKSAFARTPMVLKDPRLCITLPFWRTVLKFEPCAVFVLRDPLEVALSLSARHGGMPLTLGLAIWDRYVRQAVTAMANMPVFAIEYPSLIEEPRRRIGELVAFLADCGIEVPNENVSSAFGILEPGLRYQRADGDDHPTLADEERNVLKVLRSSLGSHTSWSPPELGEEPSWVDDVIELTKALHFAQSDLKLMETSRLFRATQAFWRLTGRGPVFSVRTTPPGGVGVITSGHAVDGVTTRAW